MKKILLIVALIVCFAAPAFAWEEQESWPGVDMYAAGINIFATGIAIGPVQWAEYEKGCHYVWNESFYWGGLSIDLLAIQGLTQSMQVTKGCANQYFENRIKLETGTMCLKMSQEGYQNAHVKSYSYGGPSVR